MLPKKNCLKKKKDIERVLKKGKTFKKEWLLMRVIRNKLNVSRFGIVVGKNFSKKAVLRNKIKRKIREAVQMRLNEIKRGVDILLMVKKKGNSFKNEKNENFLKVKNLVEGIFKKAKLIK